MGLTALKEARCFRELWVNEKEWLAARRSKLWQHCTGSGGVWAVGFVMCFFFPFLIQTGV